MKHGLVCLSGLTLLLFSGSTLAHTFAASGAGFSEGFAHPIGGLDHLLAMVAVGLWASQIDSRMLWRMPAAFIGMMTVGGWLGMAGLPVPAAELGVTGSVVLFGLLIALAPRMPVWLGMVIVGLFAVSHGYTHGAEMPQAASPFLYTLGFTFATALLHMIGATIGMAGRQGLRARVIRAGGAAIAASGAWLLVSL